MEGGSRAISDLRFGRFAGGYGERVSAMKRQTAITVKGGTRQDKRRGSGGGNNGEELNNPNGAQQAVSSPATNKEEGAEGCVCGKGGRGV